MIKSKWPRRVLAAVLTVLVLAFIWGNSCMDAEASGEISDGLGALLAKLLGEVNITLLRKLGHFSEFAALGLLLQWDRHLWERKNWAEPLLIGVLCAMTDETIQIFSLGRASMVTDVWIDFGGILAGSLCFWILARMKRSAAGAGNLKR